MGQALVVVALAAVAIAVSLIIQRRQPNAQVATSEPLPTHIDRSAFVSADVSWLLVVFSSATCLACADVWKHVQGFERSDVAVQDVEVKVEPELHRTYNIDSVPSTLLADSAGIVRKSFIGPLSPSDIDEISAVVSA